MCNVQLCNVQTLVTCDESDSVSPFMRIECSMLFCGVLIFDYTYLNCTMIKGNDEHKPFSAIEKVLAILRGRLNITRKEERHIDFNRGERLSSYELNTQKGIPVYYRNVRENIERRLAMMHANAGSDLMQSKANQTGTESCFIELVLKYKRYCDINDVVSGSNVSGRQLTSSHISIQLASLYSDCRWRYQFNRINNARCIKRLGKMRLAELHDKWIIKRKFFGQWLQNLQL
jgi:hypothetical protein